MAGWQVAQGWLQRHKLLGAARGQICMVLVELQTYQSGLEMRGSCERGNGTVLTPDVPDDGLEKRFQEGRHLGREQVHSQNSKPSLS